jgi:hypothetical protein
LGEVGWQVNKKVGGEENIGDASGGGVVGPVGVEGGEVGVLDNYCAGLSQHIEGVFEGILDGLVDVLASHPLEGVARDADAFATERVILQGSSVVRRCGEGLSIGICVIYIFPSHDGEDGGDVGNGPGQWTNGVLMLADRDYEGARCQA